MTKVIEAAYRDREYGLECYVDDGDIRIVSNQYDVTPDAVEQFAAALLRCVRAVRAAEIGK